MTKLNNLSTDHLREKIDLQTLQKSKTVDELVKNLDITENSLSTLSEKEKSKVLKYLDNTISSKIHFYEQSDLPNKWEMLSMLPLFQQEIKIAQEKKLEISEIKSTMSKEKKAEKEFFENENKTEINKPEENNENENWGEKNTHETAENETKKTWKEDLPDNSSKEFENNEKIRDIINEINLIMDAISAEEITKDSLSIKHKNQIIDSIKNFYETEKMEKTIPEYLAEILSNGEKNTDKEKNNTLNLFESNSKKIEKMLSNHRLWEKIGSLNEILSDPWYQKKFNDYIQWEQYEEILKIISLQRSENISSEKRNKIKNEMNYFPDSSFRKSFNTVIKRKEKANQTAEEKKQKIDEFVKNEKIMNFELNHKNYSLESLLSRIFYWPNTDEIFSANEKENEYKEIINVTGKKHLKEKMTKIYENRKKSLQSTD